jgi:hypothetical protein
MADPNAPSWLTAPDAPAVAQSPKPAEKPAKTGGIFRMFSKEAATAHAQKAVVEHATKHTNIPSAPDDGFTPSWALPKAYDAPNDIENAGSSGGNAASTTQDVSKPLDIDPETLKRIRFYHRILRLLYMVASAVMGTAAGLSLVLQTNISAAFFAIYVLFFCLLMCCFEVGLSVSL